MEKRERGFFGKLLVLVFALLAFIGLVAMTLSVASPYIDPKRINWMPFFGLAFWEIFIFNVLVFIALLLLWSRKVWIGVLALVIAIPGLKKSYSIGSQVNEDSFLRLMTSQALESMLANGVQGLIVEPSKSALPNPNMDLYAKLRREKIPLVFFNAKYPWADQPCVAMDDEAAGRTVTDYLFDCGHTKIAGVFALDDVQGHKRYSGFMQSCLTHGIRESERNVIWFATSEKNDIFSYTQDKLLGLLKDKSAVVCYNDKIAVKMLKLCRDNGIRVPEDISVVGIDDSRYASICEVPLTTVHHPQKKLGEAAAKLLLDMIEGRETSPKDMLFTPELVVRESVADLKMGSTIQSVQRKKGMK